MWSIAVYKGNEGAGSLVALTKKLLYKMKLYSAAEARTEMKNFRSNQLFFFSFHFLINFLKLFLLSECNCIN